VSWLVWFLWLRARIVVRELHPHFACILSLAVEIVPRIALSSACHDDFCEADPGLADEFSLLVVVEDGHFEIVVVGRVAYGESKLLVPGRIHVSGNWSWIG